MGLLPLLDGASRTWVLEARGSYKNPRYAPAVEEIPAGGDPRVEIESRTIVKVGTCEYSSQAMR